MMRYFFPAGNDRLISPDHVVTWEKYNGYSSRVTLATGKYAFVPIPFEKFTDYMTQYKVQGWFDYEEPDKPAEPEQKYVPNPYVAIDPDIQAKQLQYLQDMQKMNYLKPMSTYPLS